MLGMRSVVSNAGENDDRLRERTMSLQLLRESEAADQIIEQVIGSDDAAAGFAAIRCPLCRWQPRASDLWFCDDCDYPEFFYGGCGTEWNTFATGGRCPGCAHQWRWTSCLSCEGWSPHENWYEESEARG